MAKKFAKKASEPAAVEEIGKYSLFVAVTLFMGDDNWYPTISAEKQRAETNYHGGNGEWKCVLGANDEFRQVIFYSILHESVPEAKRAVMAELIARLNAELAIGNFELNMDDGGLCYRTVLFTPDSEASEEMIRTLLYANVETMDKYFPGLMGVLYAGVSPKDAVKNCESA